MLDKDLHARLGYDYDDAIRDTGNRALVSSRTPSTYIDAHGRFGVELVAVPPNNGEPFYASAVLNKKFDAGGLMREMPTWPGCP